MYGSAVAVGAIGRGFLQVDRVERLQQRPIAKMSGLGEKEKEQSEWVEFGCPYA